MTCTSELGEIQGRDVLDLRRDAIGDLEPHDAPREQVDRAARRRVTLQPALDDGGTQLLVQLDRGGGGPGAQPGGGEPVRIDASEFP